MMVTNGAAPVVRKALAGLVLGCALAASDAGAQDEVILPELPFTLRNGPGARAAGMGFAHAAVAEDGSALFYNPAGLAQVRRIEVTGGILHESQDRELGFNTATENFSGTGISTESTNTKSTELGHLSLTYPFPAYRGSLVLGIAYQRVSSLKSDYFRSGFLIAPVGSNGGLLETESFEENGHVNYWTAGLAGDLSPRVSIGAALTYIQGSTFQDFQIARRTLVDNNPVVSETEEAFQLDETIDADLDGYTASFGTLIRASDLTRLAFVVDFPQRFNFSGAGNTRLEDLISYIPDEDGERFPVDDEITLPFSFVGGLAVTPPNFLLAADLRFTDWTQIDYAGEIETRDREKAYKSTVDINLGAEFQLPFHPTRVRAGYSIRPLPYRLMASGGEFVFDEDDPSTYEPQYANASIDEDRRFFTLGIGTLIDNSLTLDVAYVRGMYTRSGDSWENEVGLQVPRREISEEWTTNRIFGSATFRF